MSNKLLSWPTGTPTMSSFDLEAPLLPRQRQEITAGTRIGNYRIESYLDRGGMASVYEATDLHLNRPVALKVLVGELAENSDFRARFVSESRFAASLEHPNIVPIYDAGEIDGLLYIAMRLVRGTNLAGFLSSAGPLEPSRAVDLLAPAASALDAAHAAGLIHRDVKPANFLLATGRDGHRHVYLADFGLTKRVSASADLTVGGTFVGTMEYSSPEQIRGEKLDSRSDLYALGCVAYQCLTGLPPFVRDDQAALLWAHLAVDPAPVSTHCPDLAGADAVFARCLAKSPQDRFDTCGQFIDALADACRGRHRPAPAPVPMSAWSSVSSSKPSLSESASSESDVIGSGAVTPGPVWNVATQPGTRPPAPFRQARSSPPPAPRSEAPPAPPIAPNRTRRGLRPTRRYGVSIVALLAVSTLLALVAVTTFDLPVLHPEAERGAAGAALPGPVPPGATPPPVADATAQAQRRPAHALAIPRTLGSPIEVGPSPEVVTMSPDGRNAYIAHGAAGFLTVLDTVTDQAPGRIDVPSGSPQHVAVAPDGSRAFVSVTGPRPTDHGVAVLETATSQFRSTISLDHQPTTVAVDPDQRYLYVPGGDAATLAVLDATTGRSITEVAIAGNATSVRISADGAWGYLTVPERNQVTVFDTADYRVLPPIQVGTNPRGMALSPDGKLLAVACFGSDEVYVLDTATRQVVHTVRVGTGPMDVAFTPDGRYLYTADVTSGTVTVIDPIGGAPTATIATPSPTSVSFLPDGTKAFVTNRDSGTITVLAAAS